MIKMFVNDQCYEDESSMVLKKHETDHDAEGEKEEDTLSFYELSINSDADAWEDSSGESKNSSFKSSEQEEDDYFEFVSEELKMNTIASYQPENIVFCGKIIPYKQPISENKVKKVVKEKKNGRRGLFRWRWNFTSSYRSSSSRKNDNQETKNPCTTSNAKKELQPESPKQKCGTRKRSKLHGFTVQKLSIFTSPTQSRWYLYLFGISKFRSEMELRDIKNRQSRRSPSFTLFKLESGDDHNRRECKGAWGLLKALSCGGGHHQANAVVLSSICRIPQYVN